MSSESMDSKISYHLENNNEKWFRTYLSNGDCLRDERRRGMGLDSEKKGTWTAQFRLNNGDTSIEYSSKKGDHISEMLKNALASVKNLDKISLMVNGMDYRLIPKYKYEEFHPITERFLCQLLPEYAKTPQNDKQSLFFVNQNSTGLTTLTTSCSNPSIIQYHLLFYYRNLFTDEELERILALDSNAVLKYPSLCWNNDVTPPDYDYFHDVVCRLDKIRNIYSLSNVEEWVQNIDEWSKKISKK